MLRLGVGNIIQSSPSNRRPATVRSYGRGVWFRNVGCMAAGAGAVLGVAGLVSCSSPEQAMTDLTIGCNGEGVQVVRVDLSKAIGAQALAVHEAGGDVRPVYVSYLDGEWNVDGGPILDGSGTADRLSGLDGTVLVADDLLHPGAQRDIATFVCSKVLQRNGRYAATGIDTAPGMAGLSVGIGSTGNTVELTYADGQWNPTYPAVAAGSAVTTPIFP